jgi:hypothetical protein
MGQPRVDKASQVFRTSRSSLVVDVCPRPISLSDFPEGLEILGSEIWIQVQSGCLEKNILD